MTIGIDIDDTLVNTNETIINEIKKHPERKFDINDIDSFKEYVPNIMKSVIVYPNVCEVLNYFKSKGIRIVLITARNNVYCDYMDKLTIDYLKEHDIYYDKLIMNQDLKSDACKKENVTLFIDDNKRVLDDIKKHGIKTIMFGKKKSNQNHLVMDNWFDIKKFVDSLEGDNIE